MLRSIRRASSRRRPATWSSARLSRWLPEDDLETALRPCEMNDEEHMPVVDNSRDMRVVGELRSQDLVLAYHRALLAARAAERGES